MNHTAPQPLDAVSADTLRMTGDELRDMLRDRGLHGGKHLHIGGLDNADRLEHQARLAIYDLSQHHRGFPSEGAEALQLRTLDTVAFNLYPEVPLLELLFKELRLDKGARGAGSDDGQDGVDDVEGHMEHPEEPFARLVELLLTGVVDAWTRTGRMPVVGPCTLPPYFWVSRYL